MEAQSGFFIMFLLLSIFSILGLLWSNNLKGLRAWYNHQQKEVTGGRGSNMFTDILCL